MLNHVLSICIDWDNDGAFTSSYEIVTPYVMDLQLKAGSTDLLKSRVAGIGQLTLTVKNTTKLFSPSYTSGPLYGLLMPGRAVRVQVTISGVTYTLFKGFTISIAPKSGSTVGTVASIVCEDELGYLQDYRLRMPLLTNQTADTVAKHVINFALGAPTATASATFTANPADNDTITVNGTVYTFKTALGATANQVLIGSNTEATALNLAACVNGANGSGTTYTSTSTRPAFVTASYQPSLPSRATMWHVSSTIVSGGALAVTADTTLPFRHQARQNPAVNGDTFSNKFFIGAGTYTLSVLGAKDTNCGIIDWYIDNALVISTQDWYAAATTSATQSGSVTIASSGEHVLKGVINSKNVSSSAFQMHLTKMYLKAASD